LRFHYDPSNDLTMLKVCKFLLFVFCTTVIL